MKFNLILISSLLILALVVVPIFTFYFDTQHPLSVFQTNTLHFLVKLMLGLSIFVFIVGEITKNNSQVDKLWSILPAIYVWIVAYASDFNSRNVLMAILATIWAARLTYNFNRRGGYSWKFWEGEEDYRWEVLRQNPVFKSKIAWKLFHLLFICVYQMALILLFTLPSIVAWQGENPIGLFDVILTGLFLFFVIFETVADQQQWNYQTVKYAKKAANEPLEGDYAKGFVDKGLWSKMRHPNYFAEQSIWLVFYLFSVSADGRWLNWSVMGIILLLLLFQGSADFSEKISAEKYPAYKDYIKRVPRFLPKIWNYED
jgi:steroid 5-alpha reductase family enzyme